MAAKMTKHKLAGRFANPPRPSLRTCTLPSVTLRSRDPLCVKPRTPPSLQEWPPPSSPSRSTGAPALLCRLRKNQSAMRNAPCYGQAAGASPPPPPPPPLPPVTRPGTLTAAGRPTPTTPASTWPRPRGCTRLRAWMSVLCRRTAVRALRCRGTGPAPSPLDALHAALACAAGTPARAM